MIKKSKTSLHVTLPEAKSHLHIKDGDIDSAEEAYIETLIKVAHQAAEKYIEKDIVETANVLTRNNFSGDEIRITEGNLVSVTAITVKESETPLDNFITYVYRDSFKIVLDETIETEELTVNFVTGYESGKCPELIAHAIKVKIADLYDYDRSSYSLGSIKNNKIFESLLENEKSRIVDVEPEN